MIFYFTSVEFDKAPKDALSMITSNNYLAARLALRLAVRVDCGLL